MKTTALAERVAELFRANPSEWIDGRDIMKIAGAYGWRTRIADVRLPPRLMDIENRQRRITTTDGEFTISEYRYNPGQMPVRRSKRHRPAPNIPRGTVVMSPPIDRQEDSTSASSPSPAAPPGSTSIQDAAAEARRRYLASRLNFTNPAA